MPQCPVWGQFTPGAGSLCRPLPLSATLAARRCNGVYVLVCYYAAGYFFDRFRNPHVPDLNILVERELAASVGRMNEEGPSDADYYRVLRRAYPEPPEHVRAQILQWERDERNDKECGMPPADLLLDSLMTIRKLLRIAHEDGEDWLVEMLEYERQELAARAAFACRGVQQFPSAEFEEPPA